MIIDTHIHIFDPAREEGVPWPDPDSPIYRTTLPEQARNEASPHGVTGAVVVEASLWTQDNQWILDLAADDPFLLGLVGRLEPEDENFTELLARFADNPLFRGIRFWGKYFKDLEAHGFIDKMADLAARGLVLDVIFPADDAENFFTLLERVPQLQVVIEHIAQARVDGQTPDPQWTANMQRAAAHPQVCMKASALMECSQIQPAPDDVSYYTPLLDTLWDGFGADRLLYGSNWPVCERAGSYEQCISIVRAYFEGRGEDAVEKYFSTNALRVYGLQPR
jgi:L-fuconolactonase